MVRVSGPSGSLSRSSSAASETALWRRLAPAGPARRSRRAVVSSLSVRAISGAFSSASSTVRCRPAQVEVTEGISPGRAVAASTVGGSRKKSRATSS